MTTKTVTIGQDGSMTITKTDDGAAVATTEAAAHHMVHRGFPSLYFGSGLIVGALLLLLAQRLRRDKLARIAEEDRRAAPWRADGEVEALRRRTANLERIVTDPARRTAAEIDALR